MLNLSLRTLLNCGRVFLNPRIESISMPESEEEAANLARNILRDRLGIEGFSLERAEAGDSNYTFLVSGPRDLVIKLERYHDWDQERRRESAVLRMLEDNGKVKSPRLVDAGSRDGSYYRVIERVEGESLDRNSRGREFREMDRAEKESYAARMGEALGKIHDSTSFSGCGHLEAHEGSVRDPSRDDWSDAMLEMESWWFENLREEGFGTTVERTKQVFGEYSARLDERRDYRLLHMEFDLRNLLFQEDEVVILDWESAAAGDPMLDLIMSEDRLVWLRKEPDYVADAFREGYTGIRSIDVSRDLERLYRLFQMTRLLLIFHNDEETRERIESRVEKLLSRL